MLKTASSVINALGALVYQGTWDASANSPTLTSSVGVKGNYYVVSVAGTTTLDGISLWSIGDWAVFNGSVWQKVDGGSSEAYVNLTVSGTANIATGNIANFVSSNVQISGGSVNNVTIGGTTRNTGAFTTELVGPSGSANFTRFPNAVAVISNVVTNQQNETHNIGIMGEGVASATDTTVYGVGVYGAGYTNSATRCGGVVGEGHVTASADTGSAIGVRGYANDIHAGGFNIGLYGDCVNGSTNYALYLNNGDIYSATSKTWVQNGNLTISGATTNIANLVSANVTFSGGNAAINITAGNVSANLSGSTNLNVANAVSTLTTIHGGTGLASLTAGYIPYGNGTNAFNSSSGLFFDGTNLGIGTSSPTAKLSVAGNLALNANYSAWSGAVTAMQASTCAIWTNSNTTGFTANIYYDSTYTRRAINTNYCGEIVCSSAGVGGWDFNVSGSTTSGAVPAMTAAMKINATGIITMSAYGAGAATFSASGVISSVSDETWKIKDGIPVNPDEMIQKLKPGYWFYNEEKAPIFGAERQLGFYAQNVNEAIGIEAAPVPEEGKPWGYYDRSVLAVTVMSLQKALTTIEALTERLTALEGK